MQHIVSWRKNWVGQFAESKCYNGLFVFFFDGIKELWGTSQASLYWISLDKFDKLLQKYNTMAP